MPLKFLKKCRQYNVTSKSLFVISVHHLLDTSNTVDCTISSESKGHECLENVCQRLIIQHSEFFGLRYVVKGKEDEYRWIDLDRSLSRQLEKYAASTKIYLRVRHYVTTGVRHLSDEVTRYYYFLQLKSDIYESKITCDIRTAILLALYCRQAEYDSYQNDKQTKDYLKKSLLLPKNLQGLTYDDNILDSLIIEVLQQNVGIQHLTQTQAEEMYIQCCQQQEGYGEERFSAKDILGNEVCLGLTVNGLIVSNENSRQYFPWKDCQTVTIDKRTIKIEQNSGDQSIVGSYNFVDAETARYFWKLCITQHKFLKSYLDKEMSGARDTESANGGGPLNNGAEAVNSAVYGYDIGDSHEDLLLEQLQRAIYNPGASTNAISPGNPEFVTAHSMQQQQHQQMAHGLMASTNSSALMSSNISLAASHQSGGGGNGIMHAPSSAIPPQNWMNKDYGHEFVSSQHLNNNSILDTRVQSSSCLDLSNNNNMHSSNSINSPNNNHLHSADAHERERLKAMLPTYRPAPDYETAVQLKYRSPSNEVHNLNSYSYQNAVAIAANATCMATYYAGSQPDVHNVGIYSSDGMMVNHLPSHHYPDVAQPAVAIHAHNHLNASSNTAIPTALSNNVATVGNGSVYVDFAQRMQLIRSKPPPPYPVNRLSSTSTPDLAVASHRPLLGCRAYVSGSSPDLVSNRNFLNSQYQYIGNGEAGGPIKSFATGAAVMHPYPYMGHMGHSQPYLPHGTFENLNMIEEQPSIVSQLRQSAMSQAAAAQIATKSYEEHSSGVPAPNYRSSLTNQLQQQSQIPPTGMATPAPAPLQRSNISDSIEPIYENVPLPHLRSSGSSHTSEAMRNRTSSIQSAPGGMHGPPPVPAARVIPSLQHGSAVVMRVEGDDGMQNFRQKLPVDRAASTELQFLEPNPPQRSTRAASAAPTVGGNQMVNTTQTPPPRHHRSSNSNKLIKSPSSASSVDIVSHDDSLQHQFSAMNLSSASSSMYNNSTMDTTSTTLNSTSTTSSSKEGKRKKLWNILGRGKTPDKQKSATLGREKASANSKANKARMAQDDLNLPHRWSTGVSKLNPISGQYSKDELCRILDNKLNDSQLYMEFERIPKSRESACYDCALLSENASKNSDPNFLPYDDNRVRITPTMGNRHGYVNASHISATVGTKQRFYIIAQSPRDDLTTHIFWQCVWEADVYLVVQLSEDSNYVPLNTNQRLEFGQFQIYQEFSQTTERCITSKLRLYHIQSRRYRSVWHLNYTDWVEQNCPRDVDHFLDFLEELNSVRMASINEVPPGHNTNPPVLIHCLEGSGRSGVTLTADLLLYTLDHNEDLDIPRVIGQLRHQRGFIIPSLAQYKFIYRLLITYLKRTRLI